MCFFPPLLVVVVHTRFWFCLLGNNITPPTLRSVLAFSCTCTVCGRVAWGGLVHEAKL